MNNSPPTHEDAIRQLLSTLHDMAAESLNTAVLSKEEKARLSLVAENIKAYLGGLSDLTGFPEGHSGRGYAFEVIFSLISGAYQVGNLAAVSEASKRYFDGVTMAKARKGRQNSKKPDPIVGAISEALGTNLPWRVTRPSKEAESLLDQVNEILKKRRKKQTSARTILRRLKENLAP